MDNLYLIAGLGNPGREYSQTRHNAGYMMVEALCEARKGQWKTEDKFRARLARVQESDRQVILCQPLTFMNSSGEAIGAVMQFYKIPVERMVVSVDDADLKLGDIRMRSEGSSGGHHGLDSIEATLGTRKYARQRIGIGRREPEKRDIHDHVLGRFAADEMKIFGLVKKRACLQLERWLRDGAMAAMNEFNGAVVAPETKE